MRINTQDILYCNFCFWARAAANFLSDSLDSVHKVRIVSEKFKNFSRFVEKVLYNGSDG